jgi:very-short-patch-repair endonuclease
MTDLRAEGFGHDQPMDWAGTARVQAGTITVRQLRAHGLSDSAVRHLIHRGDLWRHAYRVYVVRGAPVTYLTALWSAVLSTGGVLGFGTAAYLWGLDRRVDRVDVIVSPHRRVVVPASVRLHRVAVDGAAIVRRAGLPMTSRTWTILDHLGAVPPSRAQRLADRFLQRGLMRRSDLAGRVASYPGRRGNSALRHILRTSEDRASAESERILHRILRQAGVTGWVANHPVWHDGELVAVLDVALIRRQVAVEIDGWAFHSDVDRFQRDRERQNALISLGWTAFRFTWADLAHRPEYVASTVRRHAH